MSLGAPTISVVMPCYNTERYLGEALESACTQQPAPHEVVVVDDGSTDRSAEIAEAFGSAVRCLRQAHAGPAAARNTGLRAARGELIAFLDADDLWTEGSLACRLDVLLADPAIECAAGLVEQFISPEVPDEVRQTYACPPGWSRARVFGTMLFRRAAVDRVGEFDETLRMAEGPDWVARADAAGVVTRQVDQLVLRRRIHGNNTGVRDRQFRGDFLRMLKKSLDQRRSMGDRHTSPPTPARGDG